MNDSMRGVWGATLHVDLEAELADFVGHYEMALLAEQQPLLGNAEPFGRERVAEPVSGGIAGLSAHWGLWLMTDAAGGMLVPRPHSPAGVSYELLRPQGGFFLTVTRYSPGWVRLTLWEGGGTDYGVRLLAWLRSHWRADALKTQGGEPEPLGDPYDWATEQRRGGMTLAAIYPGWEARYIAKYGEARFTALADPYDAMARQTRRRLLRSENRT